LKEGKLGIVGIGISKVVVVGLFFGSVAIFLVVGV
jgi:hypothetical protein